MSLKFRSNLLYSVVFSSLSYWKSICHKWGIKYTDEILFVALEKERIKKSQGKYEDSVEKKQTINSQHENLNSSCHKMLF